jgi:hypothetical protein
MDENELTWQILDLICKLAVLRKDETGSDENEDRLERFSSKATYGLGIANLSFEYKEID